MAQPAAAPLGGVRGGKACEKQRGSTGKHPTDEGSSKHEANPTKVNSAKNRRDWPEEQNV